MHIQSIFSSVRKVQWERFYESGRTVFSILGVGSTLAYVGTMHVVIAAFSTILVGGTWYGIYKVTE